jgi:phosphoglycerate kinase
MTVGLLGLDDFELGGKKVLLRADINSPLDPKSREILDTSRIRNYISTLEKLSNSKVILIAHQSRPGKRDFTTLERHAEVLEGLLKQKVTYIDDIFGSCAKREISQLQDGEILVLENVRFCSEEVSKEVISKTPTEQAKTNFVIKLSSYADFYVNDAFAVAHRSQPSVVAFPMVLPSCIGPTMMREIKVLSGVLQSKDKPKVFSLGGAKADDTFQITKNSLRRDIADKVLLSGVTALIFLIASGVDVGRANRKVVKDMGYRGLISEAEDLLKRFKDRIVLPNDMAYEDKGKRAEAPMSKFPNKQGLDIGGGTIKRFSDEVMKAKIVVAKGPAGVFELNGFGHGTAALLKSIASSKAISVIGGGHLTTVAGTAGVRKKITHIGQGGGATVSFLSDQPLPGIEVMKRVGRAKT